MNRKIENSRNANGCIDLAKLEEYKEPGEFISGTYTKNWYNVDGTRFLYKQYDNELLCFGEVLYSEAAKQANIECAVYDFCELNGSKGVITYDFLKNDEAYYTTLELTSQFTDTKFTLEEIQSNRELLAIHNSKYNNLESIKELLENLFHVSEEEKIKIQKELIKMFCMDTLFWHSDRNLWNHGVIVDEVTDKMRLAPIHDNSHVLRLEKGKHYISSTIMSLIGNERVEGLEGTSTFDVITGESNSINQLIRFYSDSNNDIRNEIENIMNSINVNQLVDSVNSRYPIDDVTLLWIKAILNYRQNSILKGIESVKININEAKMPNFSFNKRK